MHHFVHIKPDIRDIGITVEDALDILHQDDRSDENPVVSETRQVFLQLPEISNIRGGYICVSAKIMPDKICIDKIEIAPHKRVCGYMKGAEQIAVFVCTAGEGFTELSKHYNQEGDYLKGFIIDTFGSLVVEKSMDYIQCHLQTQMQVAGLKITNRYSPGYCNWPLAGQQQLFSLIPENSCNISLTNSSLMLPIKSVSGIIGIGKTVRKNKYSCDICSDLTCVYRKIRNRTNQ